VETCTWVSASGKEKDQTAVDSLVPVDSFKGILQKLLHYAYIETFLKETLKTLHLT